MLAILKLSALRMDGKKIILPCSSNGSGRHFRHRVRRPRSCGKGKGGSWCDFDASSAGYVGAASDAASWANYRQRGSVK